MRSPHLQQISRTLSETAVQVLWVQWRAYGASAATTETPSSLVDPEALVIASICFHEYEPRLQDLLYSWLERNADLLSVRRMRTMEKQYPEEARVRLRKFAMVARRIAKHPRWDALSDAGNEPIAELTLPVVRRAVRADLRSPSSLWLRLRKALGVGTKADALALLLCWNGPPLTIREIAEATSYTRVAVHGAMEDLAGAGLVEIAQTRPTAFLAPRKEWSTLLGVRRLPQWKPWHHAFALIIDILSWVERSKRRTVSDYAIQVRVRELFEMHHVFFRLAYPQTESGVRLTREDARADLEFVAVWMREAL